MDGFGGRGARHAAASAALALTLLLGIAGCESCLERPAIEAVERLPYPSCGEGSLPEGEVLSEGYLRAGSVARTPDLVERYELRQRACLRVLSSRQSWSGGVTDVEIVYDEAYLPLRVWRRTLVPGVEGTEEIRLYELRTDPPTVTRRSRDGLEYFAFRGGRPEALVGPGRAILLPWILSTPIEVGAYSRRLTLDFRRPLEKLEPVSLGRDPEREVEGLGTVQVYSVFGRESVFIDAEGDLVGDLAGLRPDAILETPAPSFRVQVPAPDPRAPL
ncbi:MAG: hypothetical protein OEY14_04250 [Myxococcales bacterium]|nr:hypothetical protein [Myxococcales bacterium]